MIADNFRNKWNGTLKIYLVWYIKLESERSKVIEPRRKLFALRLARGFQSCQRPGQRNVVRFLVWSVEVGDET